MSTVSASQIKAARLLLGLTVGELASSANIGVATIKRFEACRRHPRAPQRQLGQGARGT